MPSPTIVDEPIGPAEAKAVVALARSFPGYRPSSYRPVPAGRPSQRPRPEPDANQSKHIFGPRFAGRLDASRNFIQTGGRLGRVNEDPALLAARTNYFRATYALDGQPATPIAELVLRHERLRELARAVHGRGLIVPFVVYANLLIPGQELGVHTDVPAFRGVDTRSIPPWLLVVMAHSGLFEDRRVPIATIVLYFGRARGGEFAYYPDGPLGLARLFDPEHNSAVALDADLVFHGVDRVLGDEGALRRLGPTTQLVHETPDWWLREGTQTVSRYDAGEVRFSVSWKAYCFADEAERTDFANPARHLPEATIARTLKEELCRRGKLPAPDHALPAGELAHLLIDEFVPFPPASPTTPTRQSSDNITVRDGLSRP